MKHKDQLSLFTCRISSGYKDSLLNYLSDLNLVHIKSKSQPHIKEKMKVKDMFSEKAKKLRQSLDEFFKRLRITEFSFQDLKVEKDERTEFIVKDLNELAYLIQEEIDFYTNRYSELERYVARARIELESITTIRQAYVFLERFNLKRESLSNFSALNFSVFTTFKKNQENLSVLFNFSEFPNVHEVSEISDERIVFYVIYPRDLEESLRDRINIIYAEEVPIYKKYLTSEGINFTRIVKEIEIIESTLFKYEKELKRIRNDNLKKFAALNEAIQNIEEYNWAEKQFEELPTGHLALEFFAPNNEKKKIKKKLTSEFKDKIIIESVDLTNNGEVNEKVKEKELKKSAESKQKDDVQRKPEEGDLEEELKRDIPTVMRNPWFLRPFEVLTKMYGIPSYSEIDPTPFLALTFPLLFGLMFGDIGHGLSLIIAALLGAFLFKKKKGSDLLKFCWIIFYCGWGAILGGFLYGEFFGEQELLGMHLTPILTNPLDNIMTVFMFVVFIGVLHVNLGWVIQGLNYVKQKRKYLALSDSFIKILLLSGGAFLIFNWGFDIDSWMAPPFPILLPVIPGLLLILLKPVGKILGISYLKEESYGSLMGEGSLEAFETLLSILSNAASYIRLLALALAHIALMIAIQAMVDLAPGGIFGEIITIIGLIFGNFIVIVLEGLLVFINNIRLHFYEFFFKFYQGSGIEYFPFFLDNDYSIITFKVEKDIISEEIDKEIDSKIIKDGVDEAISILSEKFF